MLLQASPRPWSAFSRSFRNCCNQAWALPQALWDGVCGWSGCCLCNGSLFPTEGWDGARGGWNWPWSPCGIALYPEATSDPQGAAGPPLCQQWCLVLAVTVVPSFLPS